MLLKPGDNQPPDKQVGEQNFVLQGLARERGCGVGVQPVLDVLSVVRVTVGCNHGVFHQRAFERHVAQLHCATSRDWRNILNMNAS